MKYNKEALVIVSELVERGFVLNQGSFLNKNDLTVWIGKKNALIDDKKRHFWIPYKSHQSINTVLKLVDGYLAWYK